MSTIINPSSLSELKKRIPVVNNDESVESGYVVEITETGNIRFKRYKKGKEFEKGDIIVDMFLYDNFDSFLKDINAYAGNKKVYLSKYYATLILSVLNGGYPEDYE